MSLVAASQYARCMHTRTLITAMAMVAMASCADEPTSSIGQSALCPPAPCSSCDIGYFGPDPVPANATLVEVTCTGVCADKNAPAHVWFLDGNPNDGPHNVLGNPTAVPPHSFAIPSGTTHVTVVTEWGVPRVAFDGCN